MGNATSSTANTAPSGPTAAEKAAALSMDKQFITAIDQNAIILNDIKRLQDIEKGLYTQLNKLMTPVAVAKGPTCNIQSCPDGFSKATNTKECQGKPCCCVAGATAACGEACAHDRCNDAKLKWVPLNYEDHPFTCVSSDASPVASSGYEPNVYIKNNPALAPTGGWGGLYTCPDGQEYVVGDHGNECGARDTNKWGRVPLSGIGGKITKACTEDYADHRNKAGWGVICGKKKTPALPSKDNLAARESILRQINDIVEIRVNLFKQIRNEYTESQQSLEVQSQDLASQKKLVDLVEDELNTVRRNVNNMSTNQDTQLRMVEIGNYQFQKYQAHKALIKVIFYCTIIILLASVLLQIDLLPSSLGSLIIAVTFVTCCIIVLWKLNDMYSRSNMNYNQFVFDKPSTEASGDSGDTVWQHDKIAFEQAWRDTKSDTSSADEYVDKETKGIFGPSKPKGSTVTPKGSTVTSKTGLVGSFGAHINDDVSDIMGTAGTIL